jgi:predicted CXXCH cytochrome family protein
MRAAFDEGPHRDAFFARGFLDCIECHGAHEILSADAALVTAGRDSACRRCHARGQEVYTRIGALGEALERSDAARRRIAHGDAALRAEADAVTTELVSAVHRLAVEEVAVHARSLADIAARAPREPPAREPDDAQETLEQGIPRTAILAAVAIVIGIAFAVWRWRRRG